MAKRCGFYARQTNYARVHNNKKMHSGLVSVDSDGDGDGNADDVLIIPSRSLQKNLLPPRRPWSRTPHGNPDAAVTVLLFAPFYRCGGRFASRRRRRRRRRRVGANFLRSALVSAAADRSLVALRLTASRSNSSSGSSNASTSTGSGVKNKSVRGKW